MTISLPDVNVWIALVAEGHSQHGPARAWFTAQENASVAFCRITQMGLLRLVTNSFVMRGGRKTIAEAWRLASELRGDRRVIFIGEPNGIDFIWQILMTQAGVGPSSWTDAYLAAFAHAEGAVLVTFDQGFGRWPDLSMKLLSSKPAQDSQR